MNASARSLWAAIALAVIAALVNLLDLPAPLLRAPLGLLLALALPGYALLAAAMPRRRLGLAPLAALSVGLSLALGATVGPLLSLVGVPLRAESLGLALAGLTVAAAAVALARGSLAGELRGAGLAAALPRRQLLMLALALGLSAGALGVALAGKSRFSSEQFTQLWALPDAPGRVALGVRSEEAAPARYSLTLTRDGEAVASWDDIRLDPGAVWETTWAYGPAPAPTRLDIWLYRDDSERAPYRQVALWLE